MLEGGHASNALPNRARATVNCRMLPDENPQDVLAALQQAAGRTATVTGGGGGGAAVSPPSPLTREVMEPIERITKEMWNVPVVPTMGTGATDNRYFRSAGIPGYGVSGTFYDEPNTHGMNEHISTRAFYQSLEFLYRLTKAYTSPAAS
jgi:acetylornithine deacetylase/succinyl-diaminopimelate desuccinylase-like protein